MVKLAILVTLVYPADGKPSASVPPLVSLKAAIAAQSSINHEASF